MSVQAPEPKAASVGVVLGAALALVALAGLVYVLATRTTGSVDAQELLAQWFEPRELPFGLVAKQGEVLVRGDVALRLELEPAVPEAARVTPASDPKPGERVDWAAMPIGAADTAPCEVLIVRLPLKVAAKELDAQFKGGIELGGNYDSLPPQGGTRIVDRGRLPWGAFDAAYVAEREFEPGVTFRDRLRVNLSREGAPCVLIARWPRGFPASKRRVTELLAALAPRA